MIRRLVSPALVWSLAVVPSAMAQSSVVLDTSAPDVAVNGEPVAVVWEHEGDIVCSFDPPEPTLLDAFIFDDNARWSVTATDGSGLQQGDPTQLTWGIVADGTAIPGYIGEPSAPSDLIAFLDGLIGAGPGGSDLTQRPWFDTFEEVFTAWGELTGVRYTYQAADDGVAVATAGGSAARPDLRIGGHFIDGQSGSNVLAYNFFPNNGDMIIDTSNSSLFGSSTNNFRALRNTLSHEHGHGLGFDHVCPIQGGRLMEPFISLSFDGPQEDDILMANRGYGDTLEFPGENDTAGTASNLGGLTSGDMVDVSVVSIDDLGDEDYFAFTVPSGYSASATVTPTGTTYLSGPQNPNGSCSAGTSFDALRQSDLQLELRGLSGAQLLAVADANGLGGSESLADVSLSQGGGTYYVHVSGADTAAQMYNLSLSVMVDVNADADVSVTKTAGLDPAVPNTSLVYTVTVVNAGPGIATGVEVTETLPTDVTLSSTSGCVEDPMGVPTCSLGSIPAGTSKSYQVTVRVDNGASGTLVNEVDVATSSTDPTSGDQQDSVATSVESVSCSTNVSLSSSDTGTDETYLAQNTVTAGSGFQVQTGETVRFVAGDGIVLEDGFSVAGGATFIAVDDPLASCP